MRIPAAPAQYVQALIQPILSAIEQGINACFTRGQDVRLVNGERFSLKSAGGTEVFFGVDDQGAILTPVGVLPITTTATTTVTLVAPGFYAFTGPTVAVLPAISGAIGWLLMIKNRGKGTLTLQAAGSDKIYFNAAVASYAAYPGWSLCLVNDGTYWDMSLFG